MPPENCLMNSHQPWDYENTLLQNTHQNAINGVNFPIIRGRGERFSLFNIYLHKEAETTSAGSKQANLLQMKRTLQTFSVSDSQANFGIFLFYFSFRIAQKFDPALKILHSKPITPHPFVSTVHRFIAWRSLTSASTHHDQHFVSLSN